MCQNMFEIAETSKKSVSKRHCETRRDKRIPGTYIRQYVRGSIEDISILVC